MVICPFSLSLSPSVSQCTLLFIVGSFLWTLHSCPNKHQVAINHSFLALLTLLVLAGVILPNNSGPLGTHFMATHTEYPDPL